MKKYSLLIFIGIGLTFLGGLMFFVLSPPQPQSAVKAYTVPDVKSREMLPIEKSTAPQTSSAAHQSVGRQNENKNEKFLAEFEQIQESEAYQSFLQTKEQDWNRDDIPDISFQEFFDFFSSQGMPHIDFGQSALEIFRQYFSEGDPEDYDEEMAARYREVFAATPGDIENASIEALTALVEEPDFTAWMLGRFKGEIGQFVQWFMGETAIAAGLETSPLPPQGNAPLAVPSITEAGTANPTTSLDSLPTPPSENMNTATPEVSAPVSLSTARISSIREALNRYGTDAGLLHLLETDVDAADWLLEQFDSPDAIEAWLSETETGAPPPETRGQGQRPSQPSPIEVPPWEKTPK